MSATPKNSFKPVGRKPRAPRRGRRAAGSSDEEDHSSDSASTVSDSDTLSSEDALTTPAPPDHSVSPPSKRRSKKKATEPLIPAQPTSWSELVSQEDDIHQEPPIIDFADFVSGPGPSAPVARGRSKPRGGKTQRQAYLERLSEDPSFIPRVGQFWGHDERLLAPELRGMSDWWRGRWNGRGRGRGRGVGRARPERPVEEPETAQSAERTWGHDGFEKMKDQERDRPQRGRGRGRGRGGRGGFVPREPEQLWTKAPDTHLHIDPSTRPQFPGQGRGIKVNLPGQWRPSIVRIGRNPKPAPTRPAATSATEVPAEIVVKLPGKQAQVVAVASSSAPKPTVPEEPETVQPLDDVPPTPTARLPGSTAPKPAPEFIPRPAPTTALPAQVLQQPAAPAQAHGRTRSQLDAVAFARPSLAPTVPLTFGSLDPAPQPQPQPEPAPAPVPAPPADTNNLAPQDPNNPPLNIRPPMPQMASFTPPPNGYYNHNPYAYTPLDGATYYPTAQGYYPPNGFFMPPRRAPVSIRAPGESEDRQVPAWNYYPQPQHGHNPYYSPSGTPYPPQGYYQGGEYPGVYDYNGVYY